MGLVLFGVLVLGGLVGAGVTLATYASISKDLPNPTKLEEIQLPEQSVVYDRTGKVELARFGEFNREVLTFDEIPPVLIDATTAVEDGSFWDNAGFDTIGIVAAGIDSLRGTPRGASTITQQLVRQRLLSDSGEAVTELSATRKLQARSSSRSASPRPTPGSRASSGSWPPTSTRTTTATSRTAWRPRRRATSASTWRTPIRT